MKEINFNDNKIPIGKRKQAYVKWAVSKGTDIIKAKKQANKKFGFEKKEGIILIVEDYGRMHQNSFNISQIWWDIDLRKYKNHKHIVSHDKEEWDRIKKKAKEINWDVKHISLYG